jgi:hypothetical protein
MRGQGVGREEQRADFLDRTPTKNPRPVSQARAYIVYLREKRILGSSAYPV